MTSFIILHYLAPETTLKCIDCIKRLDGEKNIVVVDNASPDGSGARLQAEFQGDPLVSVVLNPDNTGFAQGNNTGIRYAVRQFDPDYVVVLNNDIEIDQKDFCAKIEQTDREHPFDLLGPDIVSTYSGVHQSPKRLGGIDLQSVRKKIAYVKRSQNPILLLLSSGEKSYDALWRRVQRHRRKKTGIDFGKAHENVILQGSCVVFSRRFLASHPSPFWPGTFMYYEMEILDWFCRREGCVTRYDPSLRVRHHQNVSTGEQYRNIVRRSRFVMDCLLNSLCAAEKMMAAAEAAGAAEAANAAEPVRAGKPVNAADPAAREPLKS